MNLDYWFSAHPVVVIAVIAIAVMSLIVAAVYFSMMKCPSCERRGGVAWKHQRKDGGPDRRFKNNYRSCSNCGWTG